MKKVIYINAGVAIASVNVINAGCYGTPKLSELKVKIDEADSVKCDKNYVETKQFSIGITIKEYLVSCGVKEGDICNKCIVFRNKSGDKFVFVFTEEAWGNVKKDKLNGCKVNSFYFSGVDITKGIALIAVEGNRLIKDEYSVKFS